MAGLLDIFGTGGADTMGLLGMSQADIARNREDAQAQALYALAGRLFQGGNTGQSIAEGLQLGQKAYKGGMQETLQGQLQNFQLQELLRKREEDKAKRQLEQQALMRQQGIESEITKAYRPQTFADTPLTNMMGQEVAGPNQPQEAGIGLAELAPKLMSSPEGRKALSELMAANKAMAGETTTLAENATLIRTDPFTGQTRTVATGLPKKEKEDVASDLKEARQFLGITTPVNEMTVTERALVKAYVDRKDSSRAPKLAVDFRDPTAVAKAQLETMGKWESYLKNSGDDIVSNRLGAFNDAYKQAKTGNTSGDGAMLYNLAKIYDSSGAVQANDINAIIGSRSIPTQIKLAAQRFKDGGTFTPEERDNLKKIATGVATERNKQLQPSLEAYRKLNIRLGGEDSSILNPYERVLKPKSLDDILK